MLDLAVAIPTLAGSIISMFASGCILFCYLVLPPQRHIRHTLILNLAAAGTLVDRIRNLLLNIDLNIDLDFICALNNSISGIYGFIHTSITSGIPCSANGLVGQVTVLVGRFKSSLALLRGTAGNGLCNPLYFDSDCFFSTKIQPQTLVKEVNQVSAYTRHLVCPINNRYTLHQLPSIRPIPSARD